jgi:hypothetical protein
VRSWRRHQPYSERLTLTVTAAAATAGVGDEFVFKLLVLLWFVASSLYYCPVMIMIVMVVAVMKMILIMVTIMS